MKMSERYTVQTVIRAIEDSYGIKTIIANRLGCARGTVINYIARHPTVARVYDDERGKLVDLAQGKLVGKVRDGDDWAIQFVLKMLGKEEGFVEKQKIEHSGPDNGPLVIAIGGVDLDEDI